MRGPVNDLDSRGCDNVAGASTAAWRRPHSSRLSPGADGVRPWCLMKGRPADAD